MSMTEPPLLPDSLRLRGVTIDLRVAVTFPFASEVVVLFSKAAAKVVVVFLGLVVNFVDQFLCRCRQYQGHYC
jgi:hypothetical protein